MRYLLILLTLVLLLPAAFTGYVGEPLSGHRPAPEPAWSATSWFDGSYQEAADAYVREHFGGRNALLRYQNLKNFRLFGEISARDVVAGKDGYLYERDYLRAARGTLDPPAGTFAGLGDDLREFRDTLRANGIGFLVVMAPGKGSFFPEHAPQPYADLPLDFENERKLLDILEDEKIDHLNFNAWFREIKPTHPYALFPQKGIHWTMYGQLMAMDSLLGWLANDLERPLPRVVFDSLEISAEQRGSEADIYRGMNLPGEPTGYPLAYPTWSVGHPERKQPRVLVVGDSFFRSLHVHRGFSQKFFGGGDFYYYAAQVFRGGQPHGTVQDLDLVEEIRSYDYVILLETETHYHRIGKGFPAVASREFQLRSRGKLPKDVVQAMVDRIRKDEKWLAHVRKKAEAKGEPLDSVIRREAMYFLDNR